MPQSKSLKQIPLRCPICNSSFTRVAHSVDRLDNSPNAVRTVVDHLGMTHVVRYRCCTECEAQWQTVESIVVGSVSKNSKKVA